ncbi:MAG: Fmu (Sun) domain-containing protein, partial [Chitinophagaceae bacterium]
TSIRKNPFKKAAVLKEITQSPIPWCKHGYYLNERPSFTFDPFFHAGAYYVQEPSSMFIWYVLEQVFGEDTLNKKVLDLCAAPGGKSTLLQSYFADGLVVSNEVIKSRAAILVENITKWGQPNSIVTNNDPEHFNKLPDYFDLIVVDAPCSGSGLFRKDPSAINEWSTDNVLHCSMRQERILLSILPSLKENGILIYSTCSYSVEEDEQIADWLANEMQMEAIEINVPDAWNIVQSKSSKTHAVGYRFYPNLVKGEGFFITVFKKNAATNSSKYKESKLVKPVKAELEQLQSFYPMPNGFTSFKQNEAIRIFPECFCAILQQLAAVLYIKKAGIEMGIVKTNSFIPAHELAVSILDKTNLPYIELNKEQAVQYLQRKELHLEGSNGWCLLKLEGTCLGWVKKLPNRINNYYPAEWRILKT